VDRLSHIRRVQVGEKHHGHQRLEGAMSMIGRTNLRLLAHHPALRQAVRGHSVRVLAAVVGMVPAQYDPVSRADPKY
jgi:hypothetical protein